MNFHPIVLNEHPSFGFQGPSSTSINALFIHSGTHSEYENYYFVEKILTFSLKILNHLSEFFKLKMKIFYMQLILLKMFLRILIICLNLEIVRLNCSQLTLT